MAPVLVVYGALLVHRGLTRRVGASQNASDAAWIFATVRGPGDHPSCWVFIEAAPELSGPPKYSAEELTGQHWDHQGSWMHLQSISL